MTGRRLTALTALLAAVILTGCARTADSGDTPAGAPGAAPSTSAEPSGPVDPSGPAGSPGPPPPSAAGALSVTGTVTAGVEPNCLLLTGPEQYLLVLDDEAMRAKVKVGARITVTGRPEPGTMSTCQQGIPFRVTSVSAG